MKTSTILIMVLFLAVSAYGQPKGAFDLEQQKSAYKRFKANSEMKIVKAVTPKTPDLMKIIRQREFSRLLMAYNLMYFDGQFDTMFRISYYYEGFNHLPQYSVEEYHDGSSFMPSSKVFYYFDEKERDTMWITQYWEGFRNWTNSMRETWRFDLMDNQYLYLNDFWDIVGEQWLLQFASRASHEYDSTGRILSITYADYYNNQWFPWSRELYEYDNQGRLIALTGQYFEETDGKWVNNWREEYQLTALNEWEVVLYYNWNAFDQQWDLDGRATDITWLDFTEFKWLTVTLQVWDGQNWINNQKGFCEYNPNHLLLSAIFQSWNETAWVNQTRERYEYDQYGFTILSIYEYWFDEAWLITSGERLTVEYDANTNPISILNEFYDYESQLWIISNKTLLTWETVTDIAESKPLEINLYPNPVHNTIKIRLNDDHPTKPQFAIYNTASRLMMSGSLSGNQINVSHLPAGIYVLHLQHNGQPLLRKFIKL
jgi:hypothetical protein